MVCFVLGILRYNNMEINKDKGSDIRWWCKLFLTSLCLTRRTTNSYSRTRLHWKNPRTWEWGWSTHHTTETQTDSTRRVREVATNCPHCLHCPSTGQCSTIQRCVPWALSGKRNSKGDNQPSSPLWVVLWKPLLRSHTMLKCLLL